MGGEILISLLVFGFFLGLVGIITVLAKFRNLKTKTLLLATGIFMAGLAVPSILFLAYGSYVRVSAPKIDIPLSPR